MITTELHPAIRAGRMNDQTGFAWTWHVWLCPLCGDQGHHFYATEYNALSDWVTHLRIGKCPLFEAAKTADRSAMPSQLEAEALRRWHEFESRATPEMYLKIVGDRVALMYP